VWFYFREEDYDKTMELFETAKRIAQGAALMTDTKLAEVRVLGSAWDGHFNKPIAEATYENIKRVGLPEWTENDQAFARAVQTEVNAPTTGLRKEVAPLRGRETLENWMGGGSDDIGDVSWNVPTVTLRYPANIPGLPGHMWANAIAMATPVAHKGTLAGAKVQALTLIDLLTQPQVIADAWTYFRDVQTKDRKYKSLLSPTDQPPTFLNAETMAKYRPAMRALYYNPSKYSTYLEQLGIKYPTLKPKSATNE
jgi:aminobenzoyl-glutamate utilization protein B